ncbi:cytochrome P450 [uncultured Ornithinimicrobium sp.]|uniref:cytochrome P450 n=1 Tax=uncultured Ornithinimicrobium sp. TaxID=259307 RepID=UPI002591AC1A|nr:cytochrome P450 [uncultured Ornithinimicrobium sp.]
MAEIPTWAPLSEEVLADQRAHYDERRRACPVARSPRGVTVLRHADVVAVAQDPATFSSGASVFRSVPNTMDPPEHTAYRSLVDAFFTRERMAALEPEVRRIARAVVAGLGDRTDAVTGLGRRFAVHAQTSWLGWTGQEDRLVRWMSANHDATRSADRGRTAAVAAEFDELVAEQVALRRAAGDDAPDDPTTELLHAVVDGRPLTDAEIVSVLRNWTAGDLGSIAASLGVVVHFLASSPEVQQELRQVALGGQGSAADELAAAVDEMLRIDDPFLVNRRVVTRPAQVGGFDLRPGERVYLNWTSANRDESVFGDPDAYRPTENAAQNLVWGTGVHVCPGRPLATMELVVVLTELLRATRQVVPDPDRRPVRETYPVGGWAHVPVVLRR